MEPKAENVENPNKITLHPPINNKPPIGKKKLGSKSIFKVALFLMRGGHRKSKMLPMDDGSRSIWRKLVGSMRPLHLQNNNNNSPISTPKLKTIIISPPCENNQHTTPSDHHGEGDGFDSASEFANSPSPASSRYASAVGLNEMVQDEEKHKEEEKEKEENVIVEDDAEDDDDDDDEGGEGDGDEMIDAKAEEFIAQFYKEMKIQRLDRRDRHYREISMRSLGLS